MSKTKRLNPPPETFEFEFEEVDRTQAERLVAAGGGMYSALAHKLIETIPTLGDDKAFVFKAPGSGEVPERTRRSLILACNSAMKRSGIPWRATYSSEKQIFVVIPRKSAKPSKEKSPAPPPPITDLASRRAQQFEAVLKYLRAHGRIKTVQVAPLLGSSKSLAITVIGELVKTKAIHRVGPAHSPQSYYALNGKGRAS